MEKTIEYIREHQTFEELAATLAEEAGELSHAALKLRRAVDDKNPTPISMTDAIAYLEEEIADVLACLEVLGYPVADLPRFTLKMGYKLTRWQERLAEVEAKKQPAAPMTEIMDVLRHVLDKYDINPKELIADDNEGGPAGAAAPRG